MERAQQDAALALEVTLEQNEDLAGRERRSHVRHLCHVLGLLAALLLLRLCCLEWVRK